MELSRVISEIITPTYGDLLPPRMNTRAATVMLLAIGLQESRFKNRYQLPRKPGGPKGPARGFWQFERGGGVKGVLLHPTTALLAKGVCRARGVDPSAPAVWAKLETDDLLACSFARMLLYTDPKSLPAIGDEDAAWAYYVRNWRPGSPHPETWPELYAKAVAATRNA